MSRHVRSHCPYCSLNCGLHLTVADEQVVGFTPWKSSPLTSGSLCQKGTTAYQQVHHGDRLAEPLVRDENGFRPASWEEALEVAAAGFRDVQREHGAAANAVLSGGTLTNEKSYLIGKFARLAFRTPNVDYSGRFCMAAAGKAHAMAFGLDRMMTPLDELRRAEVVVVVGAHVSAAFPVVIPTLLNHVRKRGGTVIVVDPRAGRFMKKGDIHVAPEPGTDAVFFNGVLRELVRQELVDRDFVEARTSGFSDAVSAAMVCDPEYVKRVADVPEEMLRKVAEVIGSTDRCIYLHGRGVEQQVNGTSNVLSIINVGLACGHVGRPGAGINMLNGQRNGQGAREWGQRYDQLPAGRSIIDPEDRQHVAERWGVAAADLPKTGKSYVEILRGAEDGSVRGLLTIGTNMAVSSPDSSSVRRQLNSLDHHVVIDPFFSASAMHANVVLPGTTFAEESGTITTLEGRVVRVDQAIEPVTAWSDIAIVGALAERLDAPSTFAYSGPQDIFAEMCEVSAGGPVNYAGMTYERIRDEDGVFWPCPTSSHPGTPQLYVHEFAHADGLAKFHPVTSDAIREDPSSEYPLILTTGRLLAQFLSGNQTARIAAHRNVAPGPFVEINPTTAAAYGIEPNTLVKLTSAQGSVSLPWRPKRGIRYDTLFMPYHWVEANTLVSAELDPLSKMPGFKYTLVRIAPADGQSMLRPGATSRFDDVEAGLIALDVAVQPPSAAPSIEGSSL